MQGPIPIIVRYRSIKFNYVFVYSILRVFLFFIEAVTIQNYVYKNNSMVDFIVKIKSIFVFNVFFLLSKSILHCYNQLMTLTCIDNLGLDFFSKLERFSLFYVLNKINTVSRLIFFCNFAEENLISSISSIYKDANWLEREVYDLFGVFFYNHPDLRRILTDYGFQSFPLRKDFPLTGYFELNFSEKRKNLQYNKLKLMQEFRVFNFKSPWISVPNLKTFYSN